MSGGCGRKGGSPSRIVTVNWACELLPNGSDAVQVTVVTPSGNSELGVGRQATFVPALPASIAVGGMNQTSVPSGPCASSTIASGTWSMTGAVESGGGGGPG